MPIRFCFIVFVALVTMASAVGAQPDAELSAFRNRGAFEVRSDTLEDPAVTQLSYKLLLKYPNKAISTKELQRITQLGWSECKALRHEWIYFIDRRNEPAQYVYQSHATFKKNQVLVIVAMRYYSPIGANQAHQREPNNNVQQVVAIRYDLSAPSMRGQLASQVASCLEN